MRSFAVVGLTLVLGCFSDPTTLDSQGTGSDNTGRSSGGMSGDVDSGVGTSGMATTSSTTAGPGTSSAADSSSGSGSSTGGATCSPPNLVDQPCPEPNLTTSDLPSGEFRCTGTLPAAGSGIIALSCGTAGRAENVYNYAATQDGIYMFTTLDLLTAAPANTQIEVFAAGGESLACDQRIGVSPPASLPDFYEAAAVSVSLSNGDEVTVVVEEESDAFAQMFTLTVALQRPCSGNCCDELAVGDVCDVPVVADCVCELDLVCCDQITGWTQDCANLAVAACLAGCGPDG